KQNPVPSRGPVTGNKVVTALRRGESAAGQDRRDSGLDRGSAGQRRHPPVGVLFRSCVTGKQYVVSIRRPDRIKRGKVMNLSWMSAIRGRHVYLAAAPVHVIGQPAPVG